MNYMWKSEGMRAAPADLDEALMQRIARSTDPMIVPKILASAQTNGGAFDEAAISALLDKSDDEMNRNDLGEAFRSVYGVMPRR